MNYPKISIVTPSFNQGAYLEETILSIVNQAYPNLEYIIIDGGSTDNSVEIIKKYEKYLTYWISEPDKGQSDAINKGLKKVTGDLFNWLNSDDYLELDALHKLAKAYTTYPEKKIFCFGLSKLTDNQKISSDRIIDPKDILKCYCDPVITQPGTFYHREVIHLLKEINVALHYCMDYEWWLKFMFAYGNSAIYVSKEKLAVYRVHPESKTFTSYEKFVNDIATILFALASQLQLTRYYKLLDRNFQIDHTYKFETSAKLDEHLIEKMIIYFSLKWGHTIYIEKDFNFAKDIVQTLTISSVNISETEKGWFRQLKKAVKFRTWTLFKIQRKLKWLINRPRT